MIETLRAAIDKGATTSRAVVESCLERALSGEGARTFIHLFADAARAEADAVDRRQRAGIWTGLLGGIPISVKDLFDIRGLPTTAGSTVLADAPAAAADAVVIERLRAAGAIIVGRTNMTEFAFSGLGLNPHYGTPANPFERPSRRIPGGSSSGAAVSICDEMAVAAIGTDTGGSIRIPAAFCGLTGFKPTASRIPKTGGVPLSPTLDSFGPIGNTVACCALVDRILAGLEARVPAARHLEGVRLGVLTNYVTDGIDPEVAETVDTALKHLDAAGAIVSEVRFAAFERFADINRIGFSPMEAYA